MSQSIDEIKAGMIVVKEGIPELDVYTLESKYSLLNLIIHIVAVAIFSVQQLWGIFSTDVDDKIERTRVHIDQWYRDRVLEFRDGEPLFWINGSFRYDVVPEGEDIASLQLIKQAAVVRSPEGLIIKVAKETNGLLEPINADEIFRLSSYMFRVGDAGTNMIFKSLNPDEIIVDAIIFCDPLLINLSDGSLISDPQTKPAELAAQAYVNIENSRNFNGSFRRTDFVDLLQNADGVLDPVVSSLRGRNGSNPFEEILISYLPFSGYHRIIEMNFEYKAL